MLTLNFMSICLIFINNLALEYSIFPMRTPSFTTPPPAIYREIWLDYKWIWWHQLGYFSPSLKKYAKKKLDWTHKLSTRNLPCGARMRKHGGTDHIECRSCGCPIKKDNHLFQCPRQFINDAQDTLDPKLYHLLKHHLTAYIQGRDLLSITMMALTHEYRVSRPSLSQSRLKHLNLDTNLYVDSFQSIIHL